MAISIRRALTSYRSFYGALRAANFSANRLIGSSSSPFPCENVPCAPPLANFMVESRRSFAKGRRQREEVDDDYESATAVAVNIGPNIKATAVSLMEAAIDSLSRELAKLRTGRASAGMLDHIIVETGGVKTPLCRMAVISVLDPKTLSVNPYDPDAVCKVVAKSSEDVKQSIRRARQKALDTMKKHLPKKKDKDKSASAFSEDDAKRLEKEIDDLTKRFIKSAEDMCKSKEREITSS
ncbi:putative phosducin-like protein 3 [Capsicum annuum]|nr:putative phosducin-like protein 3 [Capsicum annuum]